MTPPSDIQEVLGSGRPRGEAGLPRAGEGTLGMKPDSTLDLVSDPRAPKPKDKIAGTD